ncbi:MAG: tetratricopeptide repeat protein [Candidatus Binatia bacterium]
MRKLIRIVAVLCLLVCFSVSFAASEEVVERIAAGRKLLDQGKLEAAISEFQKAATMDPKYGAAFLNLGAAYERANRSDRAVEAYRKSVELEPRNLYARNNLGVLYDKQGEYDDAIAEFQNALQNEPNNAMVLKNLETAKKNKAVVQERNTQIRRAEKAVEANPKDPRPAYQLARLHASYGKKETAIEWLGKAIQLGYTDLAYVKADPAFVTVWEERDFQLLFLKQ